MIDIEKLKQEEIVKIISFSPKEFGYSDMFGGYNEKINSTGEDFDYYYITNKEVIKIIGEDYVDISYENFEYSDKYCDFYGNPSIYFEYKIGEINFYKKIFELDLGKDGEYFNKINHKEYIKIEEELGIYEN